MTTTRSKTPSSTSKGKTKVKKKRNYRKEYDNYHKKPEQKKNRATRNAARSKMAKAGKVRKGDGKDVDHKRGVGAGNGKKNLRVQSKSTNRSYPRTKQAGKASGKRKTTTTRKKKK